VACQAGQGKPARQGRKNLPLAGLAGQVADPRYIFTPIVINPSVYFSIRRHKSVKHLIACRHIEIEYRLFKRATVL